MHKNAALVDVKDIKKSVAEHFKQKNVDLVVLFDGKTRHGGNVTTFHCCIYDNLEALKYAEPKFRQIRLGVREKSAP